MALMQNVLRNSVESLQSETRNEQAHRLSTDFSASNAQTILHAAINEIFPERIVLVSSFGAESAVLLAMVADIDRSLPVIFLDTGKHYAQTLSYRQKLARHLGLRDVRDIAPDPERIKRKDREGDLWGTNPDACCTLRKVEPLRDAIAGFDAWITGRKQFHGAGRVNLPAFEAAPSHIKVNPLVHWGKDDIESYMIEHNLPRHSLVSQGYPSIGCWPCTHPASSSDDVRSGRWRGALKTECGIHGSEGVSA